KKKIKKEKENIEAATQVQKQAKIKLGEVTQDQLVTPDEKAEIDKMNVEIEKAKSSAIQVLDALPNGLTNKDLLRKRINDITSVTLPEVKDADSNGVLDTEQLYEATQAVVNAEQTKAEIQTLERAKQTEKEKLNNVSNIIVGKDDLQTRLDNIASVTSPEVNDLDGNGVLDTDQLSEASQAVVNAEQAKTAVDTKLSDIDRKSTRLNSSHVSIS